MSDIPLRDEGFVALCDDARNDRVPRRAPHSTGNRDKFKQDRAEGVAGRTATNQYFSADGTHSHTHGGSSWDVGGAAATDSVMRRGGGGGGQHPTAPTNSRDLVLTDNVEEMERKMRADAPKQNADYQLDDVFDVAYREMQYNHNHNPTAVGTTAAPKAPVQQPTDEFDF
eukprot:PhF_6_TR35357/c0_g1_i1/m.51314